MLLITSLFVCLLFGNVVYGNEGNTAGGGDPEYPGLESLRSDMVRMKSELIEQNTMIRHQQRLHEQLREEILLMKSDNKHLKEDIHHVTTENKNLKADIRQLTADNAQLKEDIFNLKADYGACKPMVSPEVGHVSKEQVVLQSQVSPDTRSQFTTFGCFSDVISLSCPDGRLIFVTSATYGRYNFTCSDCCAPNPMYDCTEIVSENQPSDWLALKYTCDNTTSCEHEYLGSPIDQCQEGYLADYMQIYFDCLPDAVNQPVGFSAYADTDNVQYTTGNVVIFNDITSNFGGHYTSATSSFQCPFHGVYFFNIDIESNGGQYLDVSIFRNGTSLSQARADNIEGAHSSASTLVIAECYRGDTVWARSGNDGVLHGYGRLNTFSGYLLHRYD